LADLSPEERSEAMSIAFPQDDPTTRHARYRMALEAIIIVVNGSTYTTARHVQRIAERGLG
jgi:hypothetical protein